MAEHTLDPLELDHGDRVILLRIDRTFGSKPVVDAVRGSWVLSAERASRATIVLAIAGDIVRGTFRPRGWVPAPHGGEGRQRYDFTPEAVAVEVAARYDGKRLPDKYARKPSQANPVRYCY
jgi:hypothetical protein